jgi:hypothetical protein
MRDTYPFVPQLKNPATVTFSTSASCQDMAETTTIINRAADTVEAIRVVNMEV